MGLQDSGQRTRALSPCTPQPLAEANLATGSTPHYTHVEQFRYFMQHPPASSPRKTRPTVRNYALVMPRMPSNAALGMLAPRWASLRCSRGKACFLGMEASRRPGAAPSRPSQRSAGSVTWELPKRCHLPSSFLPEASSHPPWHRSRGGDGHILQGFLYARKVKYYPKFLADAFHSCDARLSINHAQFGK